MPDTPLHPHALLWSAWLEQHERWKASPQKFSNPLPWAEFFVIVTAP